jgi:aryl-alcohol dehydrogenase-like predicted oxidoreductase
MAKLGIGTAGWGKQYADRQPPTLKEINRILDYARTVGIDLIDTAPAYELPAIDFTGFRVVQKTPYTGDCYALLAHDPAKGLPKHDTAKIGVSVYTPAELEMYIDDIQIVQLPLSLVDGRFLTLLPKLRQKGVEIHARSVFLRGMLLTGDGVPKVSYADCLGYALAQDVDYVIVGCNSVRELQEAVEVSPRDADNLNWPERIVNLAFRR